MSTKLNPAMVGAFILGAAVLAIASIIVFGKGAFLEEKYNCVLYFDESINGLDVGAPVDFMGVRIGNIVSIGLIVDLDHGNSFLRPVTIALDGRRITFEGEENNAPGVNEWMETLIQHKGLRAQLATQSILTGKLKIQIELQPTKPIKRKNIPGSPIEIPTIPSTQATLKQTFEQMDLGAIVTDIRDTANGINNLVNNPQTGALLTNLNATLIRLDGTLAEVDRFLKDSGALLAQDTKPLLRKASVSMDKLDGALTNASLLMVTLESKTGPMLDSLTETAARLNTMLDEQSPIRMATLESLEELKRSLRSLANLTDYLERHPEALLRGKK